MSNWMKARQEPQPFFKRAKWSLKEDFDMDKIKAKKNKRDTKTKTWLYRYTLEQDNHLVGRPIDLIGDYKAFITIARKHNCCPSSIRLYKYKKEKRPFNVSNYEFVLVQNPY